MAGVGRVTSTDVEWMDNGLGAQPRRLQRLVRRHSVLHGLVPLFVNLRTLFVYR